MRNDKRVEIISFLQKNTNSENTKNIDEIIADIYAADNDEFELELAEQCLSASKVKEKRRNRRNQLRDTVAKNLVKLMGLEMVKCIKRKGKIEKIYNSKNNSEEEKIVFFEEEKFGGWCDSFVNNNIEDANEGEWYLFSEDDKGEEWYKEWKFYYNHPFSLTDLKALTECVLQLDGTQSEYKLDLIKKLALCSGEKLVNNYIDSIKETNPNYAAVLKEYEYGIREETKEYRGVKWNKGKITYDNVDVLSNLEKIYSVLVKGKTHNKIQFKLCNFDKRGNIEHIRQQRDYRCFPLYVMIAAGRFWLVSVMETKQREWGYYEDLNFAPLDIMDDIEIIDGEEYSIEDFKNIKDIEAIKDISKVAVQHQIGGRFFGYESPVYAVIKVKYNNYMHRIPFDLINRSFGEDYYIEEKNSTEKSVRIMVIRSPYAVKQWAKAYGECIEIEGFYDKKGEKIEE